MKNLYFIAFHQSIYMWPNLFTLLLLANIYQLTATTEENDEDLAVGRNLELQPRSIVVYPGLTSTKK